MNTSLSSTSLSTILLTGLLSGVAGWGGENALSAKPRYSAHLPKTPFLPVYAVGGGTVALLAPHLRPYSWPVRGLVYSGVLTGIEGVAGYAERAEGRESWDYGGRPVDLKHALLWGVLGLGLEQVLAGLSSE